MTINEPYLRVLTPTVWRKCWISKVEIGGRIYGDKLVGEHALALGRNRAWREKETRLHRYVGHGFD